MQVEVHEDSQRLGRRGAELVVDRLRQATAAKGEATLLVSTGASQLTVIAALTAQSLAWEHITILHLDEYVGLEERHPASFRRYLRDRLVDKVHPGRFVPIDTEGDVSVALRRLNETVSKLHVDAALIGIGENAHIAFNDPPADFTDDRAFKLVSLDERCRRQQVGEGWFASPEQVPGQAITMTVRQILRSDLIVCCVPYKIKAEAVAATLEQPVGEAVPATALRCHPNVWVLLDRESASNLSPGTLAGCTLVGVAPEARVPTNIEKGS